MNSSISPAAAITRRQPVLRSFAAFPIACFTCALVTDLAYVRTANIMWADFSAWLLAAGLAGGVVAAIVGIAGWLAARRRLRQPPVWATAVGSLVVLVIALLNNLVHSRDAWTSVMPLGLALSALTVVAMLAFAWLAYRTDSRRDIAIPASGVRTTSGARI